MTKKRQNKRVKNVASFHDCGLWTPSNGAHMGAGNDHPNEGCVVNQICDCQGHQ
ncbi:hypothetical protein SAY86_002798 [Trapa natans]|uniref:Uncharacterized protein n=1 Tax=Trapa natans TaxID=22666 RepID=A0AAN7QZX3_TRANT|nr:hypothetical protein SAY86_002798 [Trapa natans]